MVVFAIVIKLRTLSWGMILDSLGHPKMQFIAVLARERHCARRELHVEARLRDVPKSP